MTKFTLRLDSVVLSFDLRFKNENQIFHQYSVYTFKEKFTHEVTVDAALWEQASTTPFVMFLGLDPV